MTCSFSKVRNDGGEGGDLLRVARVHALLRYAPRGHPPPSRGHPPAQARHPGQPRQAGIGVARARGEIATEREGGICDFQIMSTRCYFC
jgi:hypothetical protein